MPDRERAYRMLLQLAEEAGVVVTETKAAKLLYLADLRATRAGNETSGLPWAWENYGPFTVEMYRLRDRLKDLGHLLVQPLEWGRRHLLAKAAPRVDAGGGYGHHLRAVVHEFGGLGAAALADFTYQTAPMKCVKARGEALDLSAEHPDDLWRLSEAEQRRGALEWAERSKEPVHLPASTRPRRTYAASRS